MDWVSLMSEIEEHLLIYKSKELESLSFSELKEFRKFALWNKEPKLALTIFERMKSLVKTGEVTEEEILGAAYL